MKEKIEQAKAQLRGHIEPTRARLAELLRELDVPLREIERVMVDYELCSDEEYQTMASLYCDIQNALERFGINQDRFGQSQPTCRIQSHQNSDMHVVRDHRSQEKFDELCRILQAVPGYRLHPSGLAIESIGDLSCLSQERQGEVYNLMEKGFLVRNYR